VCCRFSFDDEYVEFSKHIEDRIIGTKEETAHVSHQPPYQQALTSFAYYILYSTLTETKSMYLLVFTIYKSS